MPGKRGLRTQILSWYELHLHPACRELGFESCQDAASFNTTVSDRLPALEMNILLSIASARDDIASEIALASETIREHMDTMASLVRDQYDQVNRQLCALVGVTGSIVQLAF